MKGSVPKFVIIAIVTVTSSTFTLKINSTSSGADSIDAILLKNWFSSSFAFF
jgi:hypothetical protein